MPKPKQGAATKGKGSSKAIVLSSLEDASVEDVDKLIKDLQNRQQKLKQAEKTAKRAATRRAEERAEKQYERATATKARTESSLPPGTSISRTRQSAPKPVAAARAIDDDQGSVIFSENDDDEEFVVESRRASSIQVVSDDEMSTSASQGRAQKRKSPPESEDYDNLGSEPVLGDDVEPDEDLDNIEPTLLPARKKTRAAAGAVTLTVTPAQLLKKTPIKSTRKRTQEVTAPESVSDNDSTNEEQAVGNYTPYKRVINPSDENKPRIDDFSPTTKKLVKRVRYDYAMQLSTANPFMDEGDGKDKVGELFASAVAGAQEGSKFARRGDRFVDSTEYRMDIENVGKNVDSGFRGRVVTTAQPLVDQKYGFEDEGQTTGAREKLAEALLKDGSFAFADWEKRDGYLLNPLIPKLLAKHFLAKKGRKSKALVPPGPVMNVFKDVPDSLIAFLLTVIHCAIDSWKSGVFKKVEFALTEYEDKYKAHLASIQTAAAGNPEGMARLRKSMWESACTTASIAPSISVAEDNCGAGYLSQADIVAATAGW